MSDVNRHAPISCQNCGEPYKVEVTIVGVPVSTRETPEDEVINEEDNKYT